MKSRASLIIIGAGVVLTVLMMAGVVWAISVDGPRLGEGVSVSETPVRDAEVKPNWSPTPAPRKSPSATPTVREKRAEPVKPAPPMRGGDDDDDGGDDGGDDDD